MQQAQPREIVSLSGITLAYRAGATVLKDLDIRLEAGSLHYLMGASGAGKSTLMRIIAFDLVPTEGRGVVLGQQINSVRRRDLPSLRRRIGLVFQDCRLLPYLSVFDNVALPLRLAGWKEQRLRGAVFEMLEKTGLGDRLQARPDTLSGGEQQRVAFARAAIVEPPLILADEPTGNVDDTTADRIMALFDDLNARGTTILIATHNPRLVERFPYPCFRLQDGALQAPHKPAQEQQGRSAALWAESRIGRSISADLAGRRAER